tara:strand:- start:19 stop:144 length:126 start_codon:yes stop_codon:yes gene_type:complete
MSALWADVSNIDTKKALKNPMNPANNKLELMEKDMAMANKQ